jgi:Rps23 Pro-64 3,4-dihydroxylase Tpa1-like proline 4-hydroxylase
LTVLDLIQPAIRNRVEELGRDFQSAQPFRHVVMEDFLTPEFCRELTSEFPAFDREKARNELGEEGRKAVHTNLPQLGAAYLRLDALLRDRAFLEFMGRITGIPHLLYDPKYVGGGTHENLHGQDLDPHVDFNYHPLTQLHRRLNLIVFLNPEWRAEWGGALELHVNPWLPEEEDRVKSIVPIFNRAVVFETSEISWHGFKRIELPPEKRHLSRRSIAVYYYTRRRPADETAAEHSTVYVPRQLPEQMRAGYSLKQEDVDALRTLMARRDMLIRFLYEREKEFSPSVRVMLGSKSYKLYKMLIQPVRAPWSWWKTRGMR